MSAIRGVVRGDTVVLDHSAPVLEGKRVVVLLDVAEEPPLADALQTSLWKQWVDSSLQGPIDDEGEPSFP